jgi:hypothetical protein
MKTLLHVIVSFTAVSLLSTSAAFAGQSDVPSAETNRPAAARQNEVDQGTGYGQVTFINSTRATIDCYVNDGYVGRALSGGFFTAHAPAGQVKVLARTTDGRETEDSFHLPEGDILNYTIIEEQPNE